MPDRWQCYADQFSLSSDVQDALLKELFLTDSTHIGVSYLRVSIGASDLSVAPFTYNDLPTGETDVNMTKFSIEKEKKDLLPILKKIVALAPDIKILGSPWSAPSWMKTNNASKGGSLKPGVLCCIRAVLRKVHPGYEGGRYHY